MSIRHATLHRAKSTTIIKHFNQDDGTWTDIPRCVEHEPGVEEQIPGLCPGVSGYCATGFLNGRCRCQKVPTGTNKKTNPLTLSRSQTSNSGLTAQLGEILIPFAQLMGPGRPTPLVRYCTCLVSPLQKQLGPNENLSYL